MELRESMGRVSSGKTDLLFQRTEFPGQEETGRKTELERRLRDLTIRVRNGQGHERFQTEDADLSVSEMTALNGALTEEMGALSYFTDLYVAKAGKNLLSVSAPEKDGKIRSVFFAAVDRRLYLLEEDKEYQEGDLRRLLEMEGEDHGEYTGIVSDDGRRTGGLAALLEASRPYTVLLPEEYRKKAYEGPLMAIILRTRKPFMWCLNS